MSVSESDKGGKEEMTSLAAPKHISTSGNWLTSNNRNSQKV